MDDVAISGSLRQRLMFGLVLGAAVLGVILFFAVRSYATQVAQRGQDGILAASAASILDAASVRGGVVDLDIPISAFTMLSTPADDKVFYAVRQDGAFLTGYRDLAGPAAGDGGQARMQSFEFQGDPVRAVTASRTLIGLQTRSAITVTLAQTQDALAVTLQQISRNAAFLGFGFFALAVALSYVAANAAIRPLERLTDSVARRGPQDLSPFEKPVPAEMGPLVGSLNSLMGRLDMSLQQSEDFIAEAAHRVRTPLATVRSYAEGMLQRVDRAENRTAVRSMVRAIDESSRAAGQLLDHAMITFRADHLESQQIDLVDLVQTQVTQLSPIADMKDLELRLHADGAVPCQGDAILIQNAVRNLIDNALKYAPAESVVDLTVTATPRPTVVVRDQGQGFPPDNLDTLALRFQRGDNAKGTIGSGLGLTIAQDVAQAHGGSLVLANQDTGGACVTLSL